MTLKKLMLSCLCMAAAVSIAGCTSTENKKEKKTSEKKTKSSLIYTAGYMLGALDFNVDDYVTLPKISSKTVLKISRFKVTDSDVSNFIKDYIRQNSLKVKDPKHMTATELLQFGVSSQKDLEKQVRDVLKQRKEITQNNKKQEAFVAYVKKKGKVKVPDRLVNEQVKKEISASRTIAKIKKKKYKTYIKSAYGVSSEKSLRKLLKANAKSTAVNMLIGAKYMKDMNLSVKKSDYNSFVKSFASQQNISTAQFEKAYPNKKGNILSFGAGSALKKAVKKATYKALSLS